MARVVRIKKQSARGVPASGSGSFEIRVRPGQGMQRTAATIERTILDRSGMKAKARQGSVQAPIAYETEMEAQNMDGLAMAVLGCAVTAPITISNTDVTDITISGTGTVGTVTSGNLRTLGLRAGMLVKFTNLSVSGNNGIWVPVLAVPTATTIAFAPGYLVDNPLDNAFSMVTAKAYMTPTPRLKEFYTVEEYDDVKDLSKLATDARAINLQISAAANQDATVGFGFLGLDMQPLDAGDSPNFTDPGAAQGEALLLLDGACFKNGIKATEVQSLTLGLTGQGNIVALATSRVGADVGVGQMAFSGQLNELVTDYAALQSAIAEDQLSLFALFANRAAPTGIVSIYAGNCSYGQANDQITDDDSEASQQQATLYGGKDTRGEANGYAASTFVISITT